MILIAKGNEGMQALYLNDKRILYTCAGELNAISVLRQLNEVVIKDFYVLNVANWYMPEMQDKLIPLNVGNKTIKECEEEGIDWLTKTEG